MAEQELKDFTEVGDTLSLGDYDTNGRIEVYEVIKPFSISAELALANQVKNTGDNEYDLFRISRYFLEKGLVAVRKEETKQ